MKSGNIMVRGFVILTTLLVAHSFSATQMWDIPCHVSQYKNSKMQRGECEYGAGELTDTQTISFPIVGQAMKEEKTSLTRADSLNMYMKGRALFGIAEHAIISGNYAYTPAGHSLVVVDISTPGSETVVGYYDTEVWVSDIYLVDTLIYIANSKNGLQIINVADPMNPKRVGQCASGASAMGVYIKDTLAYLANVNPISDGLRIVNIANPAAPYEIGSFMTSEQDWDVHVKDTIAYMASSYDGTVILNVSDPTNPIQIGNIPNDFYTDGIYVQDSVAYVVDGGVRIFDISDPTNPIELSNWGSNYVHDVFVEDTLAYVAEGDGVAVLNCADLQNPTVVGFCTINRAAGVRWVHKTGDLLACGTGYQGVRIINVANPTSPIEIGGYVTGFRTEGLWVSDTLAYVASLTKGMEIVNFADLTSPQVISTYQDTTDQSVYGVYVIDDIAYVCGYYCPYYDCGGFQCIDVSDPTNPNKLGKYPAFAYNVDIKDSLAYVTCRTDGLRIINVSDPTSPNQIGLWTTTGSTWRVRVIDTLAYLADHAGLRIVSCATPTNPVEIGFYSAIQASGIDVVDTLAYVSAFDGYLKIISVADPTSPYEVGSCSTPSSASSVRVKGNLAYVTCFSSGIRVIDVSDPTTPLEVGFYNPNTGGWDEMLHCFVLDSLIYTANSRTGIRVFQCSIIGVKEDAGLSGLPLKTTLKLYPNPFKRMTEIRYQIADTDKTNNISLQAYDAAGRLVKHFSCPLLDAQRPKHIHWDGTDDSGCKLSTGVYFVRLTTSKQSYTAKVLLLK
ncbi:MAG TPA: T9SS type A sorting domain-containing protein [candidate division WOR-3 bacterium]|uniref:T9SS type A sorting domain-containing protein n=1 Tax=candidate division WOR-3 bacterium TaxID=2052148 RepID=A0A9C9EMS6_UNCW3|nr:T9SS type A sorting domain-containing protein [candidate division WOR-3 bacterium]